MKSAATSPSVRPSSALADARRDSCSGGMPDPVADHGEALGEPAAGQRGELVGLGLRGAIVTRVRRMTARTPRPTAGLRRSR